MSLTEYRRKRDFQKTPEPRGAAGKKRPRSLKFVIQKHDASRLHYDFRLEWEGVLKSWAVPKGPSLDPANRQLAVQVEDHPLTYGDFEGIIPQGQYGGGTVLLWDRGTWTPEGDAAEGLASGKLKFHLQGEKLNGGWTLVRMSGRAGDGGKNWLLIKERDEVAQPRSRHEVLEEQPLSVLSERDLPEIAADGDRVWQSKPRSKSQQKASAARKTSSRNGKRKPPVVNPADVAAIEGAQQVSLPQTFRPQLATLAGHVPDGEEWLHEMKFDGYRALAFVQDGEVKLITRNGHDWTAKFSEVAAAVGKLPLQSGILDGEVVVLRSDGTPDFQRLQNSLKHGRAEPLVYYVFDLPYCDGFRLTASRLVDRKQLLEKLLLDSHPANDGVVRYSEHVQGRGADMAALACRKHLEGIISKRADSPYESARSRAWLKTKCLKRQEFVIGGYTEPGGSRQKFGSLLLGYFAEGELKFCGKVGTGFTSDSLKNIAKSLQAQHVDASPFSSVPRAIRKDVAGWVKPELVAEIEFSEWTSDGMLRHPSFKGLRDDKPAREIVREEPQVQPARQPRRKSRKSSSSRATGAEVAGINISHPERVVFEDEGLTKLEIARYFADVADWILPHVVDRPLSLVRCPKGAGDACFFQKHFDGQLPDVVGSIQIREKNKTDDYVVIRDLPGLIALIQFGVLEIHPWGAKSDDVEHPDRLVFDFDPGEGVEWKSVVQGARDVRERLTDLGLESFVRTSGGKGLHVVLPIQRRTTWEDAKEFARNVARGMSDDSPGLYTDNMNKQKRRGKVFVDFHRNGRGATAVANYSTRARAGAPVATPLRWEELPQIHSADQFTLRNLLARLGRLKYDPWEGFFKVRQTLSRRVLASKSP